ncbi:MAG TPA: PRC-barrel domain-containing protein [Methylovirgula sp.]|nr:PRC-barrel domain-containing protein [Methylovirgula sp.]
MALARRTAELVRLDRIAAVIFALASSWDFAAAAPTAAPAEPPKPAQQSPAKGATPAVVLDDKDVETILGREIYSDTGEDMGKIVDVLVDHSGQVRAAIIDFGGFLGVGTRKIAVDWRAIKFGPDGKSDHIVLSLSRDQVRVAPEYKPGEPVVVLGAQSPAAPATAVAPAKPARPPASGTPGNQAVPSK